MNKKTAKVFIAELQEDVPMAAVSEDVFKLTLNLGIVGVGATGSSVYLLSKLKLLFQDCPICLKAKLSEDYSQAT